MRRRDFITIVGGAAALPLASRAQQPDKVLRIGTASTQPRTALVDLINQKRAGKPITPKERPRGDDVIDLMEALRRGVGGGAVASAASKKPAKKSKKTAPGRKEMLMPIAGKKPA